MRIIRPITITEGMITACSVAEDDAPAWAAGTTYALAAQVISGHHIYESLQAGNVGHDPATSPTWWLDMGATNRWKMFDEKVGSQTSASETITITLALGQVIDSIAFLDVAATEISITMTDPVEGVVYSETIDLITKAPVVDAYTYFFEPIITSTSAVLLGIPPYGAASISITVSNPSGTAAVGTLGFGMQKEIGLTQYEASYGIVDYSKKTEDSFGNFYVLERGYSKDVECDVIIAGDSGAFDDIAATLSGYRATPLIWVGADVGYSAFMIYGFCRSFRISATGPGWSRASLKILGLS